MANVSRPASLFSATDYAVQGLRNQKDPVPSTSAKKTSAPKKKKKSTAVKKPKPKKKPAKKTNQIKEANRKKLLPWM